MLMAVIDGITNKIDPGEPLDRDIYDMTEKELEKHKQTPGSLVEAVDALEKDHAFLTAGGVFTDDLVEMWIKWKRNEELGPLALRPHPYEFHLYYDS
jgi:glutamine synthetase